MTKEMIVSSNGHETMVAILEDDLMAEVFVERERHRGVVGNVYKGRVSKVLPGMQSSFIDLGLERDGFLYVADVVDTLDEFDKLESGEDDDAIGASGVEAVPLAVDGTDADSTRDALTAPSPAKEEIRGREREGSAGSQAPRTSSRIDKPQPKIEDLLHEGQEILVQVVKEPLGTKGARL